MDKPKGNIAKIKMTSILLGVSSSIILFVTITIMLGLTVNFINISNDYASKTMFIINYVVVFIGGLIAAHSSKSKGWIHGGAVGLIYIILLVLLGNFFTTSFSISWILLIRVIIACAVSALGGIIGINLV